MKSQINKMSLLLIFIIFIISFSSISSHPLDPLSPSEFDSVRTIVQKSYSSKSKYNLTFQYVGLDEPEKGTVLKWQSRPDIVKLSRRALVHARFNKQTLELVVDLSTRSIISKQVHYGHGYPMFTLDEQVVASELPYSYKPFKDSVKKRGLDISQVVCSTFSTGWYGEEKSQRVIKVQCFYTNGTTNLYSRPLEGITVVVDLDDMKIVQYFDRIRVPLPKAEGTDFRFSVMKPPFGPRLNGVATVSPGGQGFKIDGNTIRYVIVVFMIM